MQKSSDYILTKLPRMHLIITAKAKKIIIKKKTLNITAYMQNIYVPHFNAVVH